MAHLLIPTDFSTGALRAALYAIRLYGPDGNRFTLLNTYMMPRGTATTMWNMDAMLANESLQGVEGFAEEVRKQLPGHHLDLQAESEHGDLPNVVARFAEDAEPPSLVVMGTQGASGLQEALFGSNTAAVIKGGRFPVLAVPAKAEYKAPKRIFLADDGGPVTKATLAPVIDIARWSQSEIRIVRVMNEDMTTGSSRDTQTYDNLLGAIPHSQQYLTGDNVEAALNDVVEQGDADLLVVLHRQRSIFQGLFHRSMAARLAMHSTLPLLVLQQVDR